MHLRRKKLHLLCYSGQRGLTGVMMQEKFEVKAGSVI